ncbi:MAG TPA: hypothetical protein ENN12_00765 [Epsilonproteobacteria bacterium]|nr:hypothetical protein [Campylobacterota bacterium]
MVVRNFIIYKLLNSLFLGISIGSVMSIYTPLAPSIYSIGGLLLALGMLVVAKFYYKLFNIYWFYAISLLVEFVMLFVVIYFLVFNISYATALLVYIGYQVTFLFGSYLVRAETIFLNEPETLSRIDMSKQIGSIVGMIFSFGFYSYYANIPNIEQVYNIHYILLVVQIVIIGALVLSFRKSA